MIDIEKVRKRTRKNWKKETRSKYRHLMSLAKFHIKNATDSYCYIKRHWSKKEYFALWLVAKKLEAKGFKCELKRGEPSFTRIFDYDELTIDWE